MPLGLLGMKAGSCKEHVHTGGEKLTAMARTATGQGLLHEGELYLPQHATEKEGGRKGGGSLAQ